MREITLIGQDTTCYGEDLGLKDGLALLLEQLAGIEDLRWVRFLYAYPNKITGRLLDTIAATRRSAPTSTCRCSTPRLGVLKRMKRGGRRGHLPALDREDAAHDSRMSRLRTSFIVGFPGETEKEFEELCDFVREAAVRLDGRLRLLRRRGRGGIFAARKSFRTREIESRRKKLMSIQSSISAQEEGC